MDAAWPDRAGVSTFTISMHQSIPSNVAEAGGAAPQCGALEEGDKWVVGAEIAAANCGVVERADCPCGDRSGGERRSREGMNGMAEASGFTLSV
jgi:hypothetical protein